MEDGLVSICIFKPLTKKKYGAGQVDAGFSVLYVNNGCIPIRCTGPGT